MRRDLSIFAFLTVLMYTSMSYSLEGRWSAKSQYLLGDTSASFMFDRQLQNNGSRIVYYMNVFSCKLMRYKYIIVNNQIYLTFVQNVADRYECKTNQTGTLRNKLQRVFYFYIIGNQLSLIAPNDKAEFKLQRVPVSSPKSLSGQWRSLQVNGASIDEAISINPSTLQLCKGAGVVQYRIPSDQKPQISFKIQKTTGCPQNQIYTALFKSAYLRWKGSSLVYLYDRNFIQIMTIRKIGQRANSGQAQAEKKPTDDKNAQPANPGPSNQHVTQQVVQKKTQQKIPQPVVKPTVQAQPIVVKPSIQPSTVQPKVQASNQSTLPSTNKSQSSQVIPTTQDNIKYTSVDQLPLFTQQQFLGKWIIKDPSFNYTNSGYFFLILANRIMLYGGCNVQFSNYQLSKGSLDKVSLQSTTKPCPQLPTQFKSLVQRFKQWKYLALAQNKGIKTIQTLDINFSPLISLQQVV